MENIHILLWAIGGGFAGTWAMLIYMVQSADRQFDKIDQRFDKLDEKVTDIDRRICRLEGAFSSKDCCMIKDHRIKEQAE